MTVQYLKGGEQTTINSTITELFPALAFNNNLKFENTEKFHQWVVSLADNKKLYTSKSKLSFVNENNAKDAIELIKDTFKIEPKTLKTKLLNAIGILNYIYKQDKIRKIDKVIWGYREKPKGVPDNHAGDIFLVYKSNQKPKILGVSLKAGSAVSKEPKLNSYVRTTLTKPYWKKKFPNSENKLKTNLWKNVYSKLHGLDKSVTVTNWLELSNKQKVNQKVIDAVLRTFKQKNELFEKLYIEQNRQSKLQIIEMINSDLETTKKWIEEEFRLEKPKEETDVPLVLVKAVGASAEEQGDKLAKIFPKITKVKAYLSTGSVQEWFIDVFSGSEKLTLLMTVRSDSEYR
jgi:hypothetical protein